MPFQKGNPGGGRPKKTQEEKDKYRELKQLMGMKASILMEEKAKSLGAKGKITVSQGIWASLIIKAGKGDVQAIKELNERYYGKVKQDIDANITGDIIINTPKGTENM
jgi:hypothetical protein